MPIDLIDEANKYKAKNSDDAASSSSNSSPVDLLDEIGEYKKNEGTSTVVDRLGMNKSKSAQFAAGLVDTSPIGIARSIYNEITSMPRKPADEPLVDSKDPYGSLQRTLIEATAKGSPVDFRGFPKIPELGSGDAYTGGQATGIALDTAGLAKVVVPPLIKGVKGMIPQTGKVINELKNYASNTGKNSAQDAKEIASNISQDLAGGKTNLENAKEFGDKLTKNYLEHHKIGVDNFNKTFDGNGDRLMYATGHDETPAQQLLKTKDFAIKSGSEADAMRDLGKYLSTKTQLELSKDADLTVSGIPSDIKNARMPIQLQDTFDTFIKNPTFNKAHELQSQLGYQVRNLKKTDVKGLLDYKGKQQLYRLETTRDKLINSFKDRLNNIDPSGKLSQNFTDSSKYWVENIIPYQKNEVLSQIVKSKNGANPAKISASIESILKSNDVETVAKHMGDDFGRHVIADKLTSIKNIDPKKINNLLSNLPQEQLDIYAPKGLDKSSDALRNALANRELMKSVRQQTSSLSKNPAQVFDAIKGIEGASDHPVISNKLLQLRDEILKQGKAKKALATIGGAGALIAGDIQAKKFFGKKADEIASGNYGSENEDEDN